MFRVRRPRSLRRSTVTRWRCKGRAGVALATAAIGSFFAGTVATVILALFAPPLAEIALKFGPAEFFSLMVLGLLASLVLAQRVAAARRPAWSSLGLAAGSGRRGCEQLARNALRLIIPQLADGIGFVVVAMGMFGLAESRPQSRGRGRPFAARQQDHQPDADAGGLEAHDSARSCRGTAIGSVLGILPGSGSILGSFAAYAIEKKVSKNSAEFGKRGDRRRRGA